MRQPAPLHLIRLAARNFSRFSASGAFWKDRDGPTLQQIAAATLLHDCPPEFRVKRANGRESVCVKRMSPLKARVKRSQRYRQSAIGSSLLPKVVGSQEDADVASNVQSVALRAVASGRATVAQRRRSKAAQPLPLTPEQHLGLIETYGVSLTAFNGIRRGLGGSRAGLASQLVLRAARARLADIPAKRVTVTSTGAHLINLKEAVAEKLIALSVSNGFVERLIRGADLVPIPQTEAYSPPSVGSGSCPLAASTPPHMKDVHPALGLDEGGSPSSVKVVLVLANQKHPHRLSNTILVAVCPAEKDSYDEVSEILKEHLQHVRDLVRDGVVVNGERRAVQLFLSGDYEALCTFHGHKGASATMPCLMCYSTKTASALHADLDERFGTLQDLELPAATNLRTAEHLCTMADTFAPAALPHATTSRLSQDAHRSIARAPLLSIDPRQVVPIPLHITMGVTTRLLRLAVELIISCRGRAVGIPDAYELAETLRTSVRVSPAPDHDGVFIGRACHAIAEGGDAV